ncbi:hypothetical protein CERSUDRAFT_112979 [Gelatoporia subvermispora B]|uniref:Mid2 domain-containing protein n=1 Tax=Ceriporiopsis subvermispora (strain B) TaxID=914234 RepID=M2QQI1_CERS8|nr:hypothetical protein CERSUDRAFT_112979 [Gelatoporia subvermispora B]
MQHRFLLRRWCLLLGWSSLLLPAFAQVNITIDNTAPELSYSPPACNATISSDGLCNSPWQTVSEPKAFNGTVASTAGPTAAGGDIIPQVFLTFQGTAVYIRTSSLSTAVANISLSTTDPLVSITTQVNTSAGLVSAVGLPADKPTTLAITYIVTEGLAARLDIDSITITTASNNTSPFTSLALPPSTTLSSISFSSSPVSSPTARIVARGGQTSGDIAAEVLGAVLGVLLVALGVAAIRRHRERRVRSLPPSPSPE